jgi:predicted RNA-binding protein with PIN domain
MLLLVDGYNVTRSDPATRDLALGEQRDALVRRLRARGSQMLGKGRIVVLFDGAEGVGGSAIDASPLTVLYARTGTADDAIVTAVRGTSQKVVVFSNDRGLAERVRAHATGEVEVRPASECYEDAGTGSRRRGRRPAPPRDAGLPAGANKITEEMKKLWLADEE